MSNTENKCTIITSSQGFGHSGPCDGTIVPIFTAKIKPLPIVTLSISNNLLNNTCPITLIVKTKKQNLTEIIPPATSASFTFENVIKIEVKCSAGNPANICSFSGNIQISHCICCPEGNTTATSNFISSCTCGGNKFNCIPSQYFVYSYHQGPCDNSILPVYLASDNVRPTVTLGFSNTGQCPITLYVERYGEDIIKTIEPNTTIILTVDDIKSITAKCDSDTASQLCQYYAYLDISFCICCPY